MTTELRKREVWYTLEMENVDKSIRRSIATYSRFVEANADGKELEDATWHRKIKRHSNPFHATKAA